MYVCGVDSVESGGGDMGDGGVEGGKGALGLC